MAGSRGWPMKRVAGAVLAALLVLQAGTLLVRDLRLAHVTRAGESVREGLALNTQAVRNFSKHGALRRAAADCRGVADSAMLQLVALDLIAGDADAALREELFERARDTLAFQLGCSPLNGAAWLAYGRVLLELEGPSGQGLAALERSARTAPAEAPVLLARLSYLQWRHAPDDVAIGRLLAADLGVAMRHMDPRGLAWLYAQAPAGVRPHYRDMLDAVPEPRRLALAREFDRVEQSPAQ